MPQLFKMGSFLIFFWSNEGNPLEPIHVHIAEGRPTENATKVWITRSGKCILCNNNSKIPTKTLRNIMDMIEIRSSFIIQRWKTQFGEASFFC